MKAKKLLFGFLFLTIITTSCTVDTEVIVEDDLGITLDELLTSYDLWYININQTTGSGEVPFLQKAFTVSFDYGVLMANNNLVGFGSTGNGLGIDVGFYNTRNMTLTVDHDADGVWNLEVYQTSNNKIKLYHRGSNTTYYLTGYQRSTFDYDFVFYDNIQYFLQEYDAWEKTYTSDFGAINEFDEENFLSFLAGGNDRTFLSSVDNPGTSPNNIYWDYEGLYTVYDVPGDAYLKTLTLDYDFMGNDYFELTVIDDRTIELYHPNSGTVYEFTGRGYIQYLKGTEETNASSGRKRTKTVNPTMDVERQGSYKKIKIG